MNIEIKIKHEIPVCGAVEIVVDGDSSIIIRKHLRDVGSTGTDIISNIRSRAHVAEE